MKMYKSFAWNTRLAINGGESVRRRTLPYGRHCITEADIDAVAKVMRSDHLTSGPVAEAYEAAFAEYVGTRYAVAVSSGTAALHCALKSVGVGAGDEVITTPITFCATANAIEYCGGRVVFDDVRADTLNLKDTRSRQRDGAPRLPITLPIDFAGVPGVWTMMIDGNPLIVDCAHSLGASRKGVKAGARGTASTFSTHPCKGTTTGEGGMVTTDDEGVAQFCREFRNVGRRGQEMAMLGYNYTLSDINCALGLSQLKRIDDSVRMRAKIARRYDEALARDERIELPTVPDNCTSSWHLYVIRLNLDKLGGTTRDQIVDALRAEGIGVAVHYRPVYHHPYYQAKGYVRGLCPVAEREAERVISLPIWPGMAEVDVEDTVTALRKVLGAYEREIPCK